MQTQMISAEQIVAGSNDRQYFNETALQELAVSIQQNGIAQPPTVRPMPNGTYQIVAGERRTRAMRDILKWTEIPCVVREMDDEQASAVMLVENTSREDLNPIEEAQSYQKRIDEFGWSISKIAEIAGVSESVVRKRLSLLKIVDDLQHYVKFGQMPLSHAELLGRLDANRQRIAARVWNSSSNMPFWKFKEVVNQLEQEQNQDSLFDLGELMVANAEANADIPTVTMGKRAVTGAPSNKKLPPMRLAADDTIGSFLDRYIADLLKANKKREAEAIGVVYNTLVGLNWTNIPAQSELDRSGGETAGDLRHVEIMK